MKNADRCFYDDRIWLVLPANSEIPVAGGVHNAAAALSALAQVAQASEQLQQQIERRVVPQWLLNDRLARLGQLTLQLHSLLAAELTTNQLTGRGCVKKTKTQLDNPADASDYALYEQLFRVDRQPAMSLLHWAAQIAETCCHVLQDLPFAVLNIDTVAAIVNAIQLMFRQLANDLGANRQHGNAQLPTVAASDFLTLHHDLQQAWQKHTVFATANGEDTTNSAEWERKVVFYRWFIGHHFFFLCTVYCKEYLQRAALAFNKAEETSAVASLSLAQSFLQATTATMWYASNFPAEHYQTIVRPHLYQFGPASGTSGTMVFDYEQMKHAKEALSKILLTRYGSDSRQWQAAVRRSTQAFQEIYVQDMENHTLIAASKVGVDSSLAQKVWQADLPETFAVGNAITILRNMTALRNAESKF